jgi:excisionase family DNA binding protein
MQAQTPQDGTDDRPLLLTMPEAAEVLRIGRCTLQALVLAGSLQSIQIGSRRLIPREAIGNYIETRLNESVEHRSS